MLRIDYANGILEALRFHNVRYPYQRHGYCVIMYLLPRIHAQNYPAFRCEPYLSAVIV